MPQPEPDSEDPRPISLQVQVGAGVGLHARPATVVAEAARKYSEIITVARADNPGKSVDAGSTLMLMTLGASYGTTVIVQSSNPQAAQQIATLIATPDPEPGS